jgi:hypothetical protein
MKLRMPFVLGMTHEMIMAGDSDRFLPTNVRGSDGEYDPFHHTR